MEAYDRLAAHVEGPADPGEISGEGIQLALELDIELLEAGLVPTDLVASLTVRGSRDQLLSAVRAAAGRRAGPTTLACYGRPYYRALARARWGGRPKGRCAIRELLASPKNTEQGPGQGSGHTPGHTPPDEHTQKEIAA